MADAIFGVVALGVAAFDVIGLVVFVFGNADGEDFAGFALGVSAEGTEARRGKSVPVDAFENEGLDIIFGTDGLELRVGVGTLAAEDTVELFVAFVEMPKACSMSFDTAFPRFLSGRR